MERLQLEVDGLKLSILKGKDAPIVYIHCSGCDATLWQHQLEAIGGYAVDLPNHGESCKAEIYSIDDYAYFVAKATQKLLGKAVIAGHSLGGAVAQKIYVDYKKVVKALILVGTGARLRVLPEILEGLKTKPEETAKMVAEMGCVDKDIAESYAKIFAERAGVMLKDLQLCDKFDLLDKYKSGELVIDVPTLIIVGEDDKLTPLKYAQFFHQHIPNSKLVVIPDAGHMVMLEKPEEVNKAIKEFLAAIED